MSGVIYADVLVIINLYVTYFLLLCASYLSHEKPRRIRVVLSSVFGGFYALLILIPTENTFFIFLMKSGAVILPVVIAFGIRSLTAFLRVMLGYLVCSFAFAGIMSALWYFFCPAGMFYNGSIVYFDIDVLTLVIFTVICYGFMRLFDYIFSRRAPINTVFYCKVCFGEREYTLKAFLDTGNSLTDPFTGKPIVIASSDRFRDAFDLDNPEAGEEVRFVLCNTVSGKSLLPAVTPEWLKVEGADTDFITDKVMIAFTKQTLLSGEYDAILPMGLFSKNFERKDEGESEKTAVTS